LSTERAHGVSFAPWVDADAGKPGRLVVC
jgi:hypothetical protein